MKIYKKSIVACALFSVAGAGNCGISDQSWLLMPREVMTYKLDSSRYKYGMEFGCDSFSPNNFMLTITYNGTPEAEQKVYVEADDKGKVSRDKKMKTFFVSNPTKLAIGLPYGATYTIMNWSSEPIKGTGCDMQIMKSS